VLEGLTTVRIERRYETAFRPLRGIAGEVISATALRALRPAVLRECAREVMRLIDRHRPDHVLAVLESPAAIQVAARIHRDAGIPLRSLVWDDIELLCRQAALDRWTRRWLHDDFAYVLQHSRQTAVICENMRTAYAERYGISSMVLRHGVSVPELVDGGAPSARDGDHLRIGFAGSVTAPDCLHAVVQSLDSMNWRIGNRDIALRLIGSRYLLDSRQPQRIEFLGWRSVAETCRFLRECDLLYLPQTFAADLRFFSELSFPTKLSTYVAVQRPILLHAPEYASLAEFWNGHEMGPWCKSLESDAVGREVVRGLDPGDSAELRWQNESKRVCENILNVVSFSRGIRRLLGIEEQDTGQPDVEIPASVIVCREPVH
jgi:hypothetical protein